MSAVVSVDVFCVKEKEEKKAREREEQQQQQPKKVYTSLWLYIVVCEQ